MNQQANKKDFTAVFLRLLGFMKPYRKGLIASVILIVIASAFNSLGVYTFCIVFSSI